MSLKHQEDGSRWTREELFELMKEYIKENLSVEVSELRGNYYFRKGIDVVLYLGGEKLSESSYTLQEDRH